MIHARRVARLLPCCAALVLVAACAQDLASGGTTSNIVDAVGVPGNVSASPSGSNPWLWLGPLVGALATISGVLIANMFATWNTRAGIIQKTNELEIVSINDRLKTFIGPFQQLSAENLTLARELKRRHGGDTFRTLPALLTPGWHAGLPPGDAKLLAVIVGNGLKLRDMIVDNSGATSSALLPYFSAASTHFRLLYLAQEGSLEMDAARFAVYVYPRQLDAVLELERQRLERCRETLRSQPHVAHRAMPELAIPDDLSLASIPAPTAAA